MKFRVPLFLAATFAATVLTVALGTWHGAVAAYILWFAATNLLASPSGNLCATTLTVSEILSEVMDAFKTRLPSKMFAMDFNQGATRAKYGQAIIAHLPTVPAVYDHVAATGYRNNAQSARSLLTDVSITMDGWKDVPIYITHADATQDRSMNYLKTVNNAGYALAKAVIDYVLSKALAANFSQSTTESIANTGKDTLGKVRLAMNGVNAGTPRNMLCSSDFFNALDNDPRITSGDYYGQRTGADPFGRLFNIAGFAEIQEYTAFPSNSENLVAVGFDERAFGLATRLPSDSTEIARSLGVPVNYKEEIITDPETGLSLLGFAEIDQITHYLYITATIMFGAVAGKQGGSTGTLTDYAGHRVKTA